MPELFHDNSVWNDGEGYDHKTGEVCALIQDPIKDLWAVSSFHLNAGQTLSHFGDNSAWNDGSY